VVTGLDKLIARIVSSEISCKRVEPKPEDIIRKVGQLESGVVVSSGGQPQNATTNGTSLTRTLRRSRIPTSRGSQDQYHDHGTGGEAARAKTDGWATGSSGAMRRRWIHTPANPEHDD